MTERGKITISVSAPGFNKLNFKISDTSGGISTDKLGEIFKPFALADLTNSKLAIQPVGNYPY